MKMALRNNGSATIGPYQLLELIGEGGMADVFLGIKNSVSNIRTFYALKVIKSTHAQDERFARMFLDEARVMASIRHPNLVTLHEILEHRGQYLIVMEYLKGNDGRRLVGRSGQRRPLPIDVAVNIVYQACIGLHHAHEARDISGESLNLVHRDIFSHNLFITFDGYVKVLDFGIAKSEIQAEQTKSGFLKGKVPYLSPEQCARQRPIDRRTDVWALGVVLYEFLTGKRPFSGGNEIQVLQSILNSDPTPPAFLRPELPEALSQVILKALAKKPDQRFPDCAAMRQALGEVATDQGWSLNERALSSHMNSNYGDFKKALESKLVSLLNESVTSDDDRLNIPYEDRSVQRLVLGSDCLAAMRKEGPFKAYKLSGQLRESFDYDPLIKSSSKVLILDLKAMSRVTSFGIRQWLNLLPALREKNERVIFNRVSVSMVNQMVTIPAMIEGAEVASIMVPFYCTSCAHQFDQVVRAGEPVPMDAKCPRCGADDAKFDEDDVYLKPLHGGVPAQGRLKEFIDDLERLDQSTTEAPVEKNITAEHTEIILRGDVPESTRWDRLLAGMEGKLRVEFTPGTSISHKTWRRFQAALAQVRGDVDLAVWGYPLNGAGELAQTQAQIPALKSAIFSSSCPNCERVEHREWKLADGGATAICRQCSEPLSISFGSASAANEPSDHKPAKGRSHGTDDGESSAITRTETVTDATTSRARNLFASSWIFTAIVVLLLVSIIIALLY